MLNGFDYSSLLLPGLSTFVTLIETDIRVEKKKINSEQQLEIFVFFLNYVSNELTTRNVLNLN